MNQNVANVQAGNTTDLVVGGVGGFITGVIGNCIVGGTVGAAIPTAFGQIEFAPATALGGCAANALNPSGLVSGTAGGILAAQGYNIYRVQQAKQQAAKQINTVCANLPG
jgi:hypothetical protein